MNEQVKKLNNLALKLIIATPEATRGMLPILISAQRKIETLPDHDTLAIAVTARRARLELRRVERDADEAARLTPRRITEAYADAFAEVSPHLQDDIEDLIEEAHHGASKAPTDEGHWAFYRRKILQHWEQNK